MMHNSNSAMNNGNVIMIIKWKFNNQNCLQNEMAITQKKKYKWNEIPDDDTFKITN